MGRNSTRAGARRLDLIPPYLFAEIDRKVQEKKRSGVDVISLGIGDPDLPTPGRIVSVLQETAADPLNHRYPSYYGLGELREAIARWYSERSGVELDPKTEILPTLGSKDGISHVAWRWSIPATSSWPRTPATRSMSPGRSWPAPSRT